MDLVLLELCIWSKLPQPSLTGMQYFNFTINNFTLLAIFFYFTPIFNRIVSELQHKIQVADRLEKRVESIRAKRQETLNEVDAVQKNCSRVLKKTVLLQEHIEKDLSKRYNNRKVNILGGVQSL